MNCVKTFLCLLIFSASMVTVNAATVAEGTCKLSESIANGTVRIVISLDSATYHQKDIGVILHQSETFVNANGWNDGIALIKVEHNSGEPYFQGYIGGWKEPNVELLFNEKIALWFTVDVVNSTYTLAYQIEGETEVTTLSNTYTSRFSGASIQYVTTTYNDVENTNFPNKNETGCIIISDSAQVVTSIEPYNFGTTTAIDNFSDEKSIDIQLINDELMLSADSDMSSVVIYSLNGQQVLSVAHTSMVDVSHLSHGVYIVRAIAANGDIATQKIIK